MVYLAVTRLSALSRKIKPTNNGHFHCLNGLKKKYKKVCKNKKF